MSGVTIAISLLIFGTAVASDWCVTLYVRRVGEGRGLSAAAWNTAVMAFSFINIVSWVESRWMILPSLGGYFVGTWLAVRYDKQRTVLSSKERQ